jgi:hypothetical protein
MGFKRWLAAIILKKLAKEPMPATNRTRCRRGQGVLGRSMVGQVTRVGDWLEEWFDGDFRSFGSIGSNS